MANDLKIRVTADGVAEVENNLEKVGAALGDIDKSSKKAESSVKELGGAFDKQKMAANALSVALGMIAVEAGKKLLGAIKDLGYEVLKEADHFRKLGETLGMTTEDVAGFSRAVSLAGGSTEGFEMAMRGMAEALDSDKITDNRKALEGFGVSVKDSNGNLVSQRELLLRVADAYAKETDATKKANIGKVAFGKSAQEMTTLLNQGREAIERQVSTLGAASGYSEQYARTVEKLNSSLEKGKNAAKSFLVALTDNRLFSSAISGLDAMTDKVTGLMAALHGDKMLDFNKSATEYYRLLIAKQTGAAVSSEALRKANTAMAEAFQYSLEKGVDYMSLYRSRVDAMTNAEKILTRGMDAEIAERANKYNAEDMAAKARLKKSKENVQKNTQYNIEQLKNEISVYEENQRKLDASKNKTAAPAEKDKGSNDQKADAESDALEKWLENYQKSKMSETEIAQAAYDEQKRQFNDMLTENKITYDEFDKYMEAAKNGLDAKLGKIEDGKTDAFFAEIERNAKNSQEQLLRLKEAYATKDAERDAIAIERINRKYDEELKLAKENGLARTEVEKARDAEIEALKKQAAERDKARMAEADEYQRQLRETAAITEEERINIQMERMNAKYDAERERAKENAALLNQIENARIAEAERLENQLLQTRLDAASKYANSFGQIAKAAAVFGKSNGNAMKAMAITEATINTALAATKAMASAPWPLNLVLAAGATAAGMVQVANIKAQKFAGGGVVEGNSLFGDHVPVRANSGEMILNREQQRQLFEIANGRRNDGARQMNINFSPQIPSGVNSNDVKKFFRENQTWFNSMLANSVARGLATAGVFA